MKYDSIAVNSTAIAERVGSIMVVKVLIADEVAGVGEARLAPSDAFDFDTGLNLALGRAYIDVGRKLARQANGLVKHHDDMREQRAKQLARKVKPKVVKKRGATNGGKKTPRA